MAELNKDPVHALLSEQLIGVMAALARGAATRISARVEARPKPVFAAATIDLLARVHRPLILARASLRGADAGHSLWFAVDTADALTLVATFEKLPADAITARRRAPTIGAGELELYAALADELCEAIDARLRQKPGDSGARFEELGGLQPGRDRGHSLGSGPFVVLPFDFAIGDHEPGQAMMIVPAAVAVRWNQGPVELDPQPLPDEPPRGTVVASHDDDEEIPLTAIRGRLAAFLSTAESFATVRRSCRRVGLELVRYARSDVPNPAALRDQIVLIEIQAGEERRYEWCKRIKAHDPSIQVVLLIHRPSRQRVLQGFVARADAILGWPLSEGLLTHKLEGLFAPAG